MRITVVKKAATVRAESLPYCPWLVVIPPVHTK